MWSQATKQGMRFGIYRRIKRVRAALKKRRSRGLAWLIFLANEPNIEVSKEGSLGCVWNGLRRLKGARRAQYAHKRFAPTVNWVVANACGEHSRTSNPQVGGSNPPAAYSRNSSITCCLKRFGKSFLARRCRSAGGAKLARLLTALKQRLKQPPVMAQRGPPQRD